MNLSDHIHDPERLAALHAVALLDTPTEESFDRLTRLAAQVTQAPVALVTLVDSNRQFFKSCVGLPEPILSARETPLELSICQHNRIAGKAMVIEDARLHPFLRDNPTVRDLDVVAYLGFPLETVDGYVIGTLCVMDFEVRCWTDGQMRAIEDLAAAVMAEVQLRAEIHHRQEAEGQRDELAELNARLHDEFDARLRAEGERQRLSAQLHQAQKMEAVGRLAGGVAHDLNNLLTPILGFTEELLSDEATTQEQRVPLDEILHAGLRARDLVRQLLAIGRRQALELRPMDLDSLVSDTVALLRRTIPEDITIDAQFDEGLPQVLADAGQIERLLVNLAINATDAMPRGGHLSLALSLADPEGPGERWTEEARHVLLTVVDDGEGMDEGTRQHAFEPFFTTKGDKGTGLGLATVFGIVQQHGGTILLDSEPGSGSTFRIFLPVAESVAPGTVEDGRVSADVRGTETILLAEDNDQVRRLAQTVLAQQGYEVLAAADGPTALAQLASHTGPVHLLLSDVVMPGMNGREVFERAVAERPGLRVLYMSGYAAHVVVRRGALDEDVQLIQKPFSTRQLLVRVREILDAPA